MLTLLVSAMLVHSCSILADFTSREVIKSLSPGSFNSTIPQHYDKHTPPHTDTSPVIVYFDMKLLDITSVNENDMTFSIESFMTYRWKDWRLKWPLEDPISAPCWNPPPSNLSSSLNFSEICTGNYTPEIQRCVSPTDAISKRLILDLKELDKIWHPDAFFKNGIRSSIHQDWVPNTYLAFYPADGHVRLFSRMSIILSCHFDFRHYPHDEQHCELVIQSLSYRMDLVRFEWCSGMDNSKNHSKGTGQYSLPHFKLAKYQHTTCNVSSNFTCVKAMFVLARHPDFHILHTYIPTMLIVILSWLSFWIKPNATPVSYIKSLDIWMMACMVFVFLSLLEFAFVYYIYNASTILPLTVTPSSSNNNICHMPEASHGATVHNSTVFNSVTYSTNASTNGCATSATLCGQSNSARRDSVLGGYDVHPEVLVRAPGKLLLVFIGSWHRFWSSPESIDRASMYVFPASYALFILVYFSLLMRPVEQDEVSTDIPN